MNIIINNSRAEILAKAPSIDGIYIFRRGKKILYIGKSVNIKARLLSHLENAKTDPKEAGIVHSSDTIECVAADSEFKALILESKLIQKHRPKYNARWRDDKSYLYLKVTVRDEYPKLFSVRRERDGKSKYFGPFPSTKSVEELLKSIRRIFPYCSQHKIGRKPCFYSKIKLCSPCPSYINNLKNEKVKNKLKRTYRTNIKNIVKILEGKTEMIIKSLRNEMDAFSASQHYEEALVMRNKIYQFEHLIHDRALTDDIESVYNQSAARTADLTSLLGRFFQNLTKISRIECFDISNLSGKEATASMVVFTDGIADKSQYRRFKIKNSKARSDFEMMEEVLERRLKNKWPLADIFVVDGGKPQVRTAMAIFQKMSISVPLIGIAKRPDRIVIGKQDTPTIRPDLSRPAFNLIRALRDESHRFAKKYHLLLRNKRLSMI